jgi:hypothetical protein
MTAEAQKGYGLAALKRGTLKPTAAEEETETPAGAFCAHCGGRVGASGLAEGGEAEGPDEEEAQETSGEDFEAKKQGFLAALKKGK